MTISDAEVDRALASLTDAEPSPALRANVMRRVAGAREQSGVRRSAVRRSLEWRLALAGAAVLVVAASLWLVLPPTPERQVVTTRREVGGATLRGEPAGPSGVRPRVDERAGGVSAGAGQPESSVHAGQTETRAPSSDRRSAANAAFAPNRRSRSARSQTWQASAATGHLATGQLEIGIPPLSGPEPLAPPDPVLVAPLIVDSIAVERLEIPPLQIDPVEGRPSKERGR